MNEPHVPTNEEVVMEIMGNPEHGPLGQLFVIEALRFYSKMVSSAPQPDDHGHAVISQLAWWFVAKDVQKRMEELYGSGKSDNLRTESGKEVSNDA